MIRDCNKIVEYLCGELKSFADTAVIGLSGGADSTLVAVLCARALGPENVLGVSMPYGEKDRKIFNRRAEQLARRLGIRHVVRPVTHVADAIVAQIQGPKGKEPSKLNMGNARSRARMCILYGIAHSLSSEPQAGRVRVIGTGNLSEDFIGYDTKGGDSVADIFPIADLFKSEVYQLLDHFCGLGVIAESDIDRQPTAGLWEGQTDEGELGHTYAEMEQGIRRCMTQCDSIRKQDLDEVAAFAWARNQANRHKHEAQKVIPARSFCD